MRNGKKKYEREIYIGKKSNLVRSLLIIFMATTLVLSACGIRNNNQLGSEQSAAEDQKEQDQLGSEQAAAEDRSGEDDHADKAASEASSEDDHRDVSANGAKTAKAEKFVQFDTEMYRIYDVAFEYADAYEMSNGKNLEYDLDGDGKKDVITLKKYNQTENGDVGYELLLDGKEFADFDWFDFLDTVYIVDLNKNDHSIEVVTLYFYSGDDPAIRIFTKQGSEMVQLEGGFGEFTDQKGIITSGIYGSDRAGDRIGIYDCYYKLENNTVTKCDLDLSEIKDVLIPGNGCLFTTDMKNVDKYFHGYDFEEAGIVRLTADDKYTVLGFEGELDVKVKLQDGTIGYILGNYWCD